MAQSAKKKAKDSLKAPVPPLSLTKWFHSSVTRRIYRRMRASSPEKWLLRPKSVSTGLRIRRRLVGYSPLTRQDEAGENDEEERTRLHIYERV